MTKLPIVLSLPLSLTIADLLALALLFLAWFGCAHVIEHSPPGRPSVSTLMRRYRRDWMEQFVHRDPRIFDGNILSSLREGTSFYASACMIAIGGGLALIGNPEMVATVARDVALDPAPLAVWRLKVLLALILVINAFLKFVWAHRLFGYCAILMASVPNDPGDAEALTRAARAGEVNINAARNFNAGLRAVYFAIAGLAWLAGPVALTLATAAVLWTTWRREFASGSRRAIMPGGG